MIIDDDIIPFFAGVNILPNKVISYHGTITAFSDSWGRICGNFLDILVL